MPSYQYIQDANTEILYADSNGRPQGINAITWDGTNLTSTAKIIVGTGSLTGLPTIRQFSVAYDSSISSGTPLVGVVRLNQTVANPTGTVQGFESYGRCNHSSGIVLAMSAGVSSADLNGAGTVTSLRAHQFAVGIHSSGGSGTVTDCIGAYVGPMFNLGGGTITTTYSFYAVKQTVGGTNWGLYLASAGNDAFIGGDVLVGEDLTVSGVTTLKNTGLHLLDTDESHDLIIAPGSNLTADRTLTITTGDSDRTLTLSDNTTLSGGTHSGTNTGDVTLSGTPDYISITNQVITVGLIDLTTDVTGDLPLANLTQASAASKLLGRGSASGAGDFQEITLGSGLTMTGTTLSASGGGGGGGDALTTNPLSQFAATTSAQLAGVISDETGTGALVFANTPTLVTPVLGTPTSGTLTNCTGLPISTGVSGLGSGIATFLATPSSANLAAAVTGETGSGALMFGTSPTITTDITIPNTGLHLLDTDSSHDLIIAPGSNLTADRTLTITTGDADRTLTISASATISGTNTGDVTLSGTPDYITIANQVITVGLVDLTADVTGDLPLANLAQASAASKLLGRGSAAGAGDYQEITLGTGLSMSGTTLSSTGGSGSVATDTIWDAKGDLAVGTGADTAQKLTVGSDGKTIVADSTQTTGLAWKTRQSVVKDICGGRLSLESAVSVSSSDQSGKSTIYFVEHRSNEIALYDGTEWVPRTFNNISVAVPSTLFKVFDIFAYDNSGTVTLETTDWNQSTATVSGATNATPIVITTSSAHGFSNGDLVGVAGIGGNTAANGYIWEISSASGSSLTLVGSVGNGAYTSGGTLYKLTNTRATALTTQDGVLVKTGAVTRRYLGTGMTGGTSGQMDDAVQKRMLYNFYNAVPKHARVNYATSHSYATNTTRLMNLAAGNKLWYVLGQAQSANVNVFNSASDSLPAVGLGLDSTTGETISVFIAAQGAVSQLGGSYTGTLSAGGHFMAITERAANSSSVTFCVFGTNCRVETVLMM